MIITDLTDLNYYKNDKKYRELKDRLDKLKIIRLNKEIEILKIDQEVLLVNSELRKLEAEIVESLEKRV